jgi:hypothetical protein
MLASWPTGRLKSAHHFFGVTTGQGLAWLCHCSCAGTGGEARPLGRVRERAASCCAGLAEADPEQPERVSKAQGAGFEAARSAMVGRGGR